MKNVAAIILLFFSLSLSAQESLNDFTILKEKYESSMNLIDLPIKIKSDSLSYYDSKDNSFFNLDFQYNNSHAYNLKSNFSYLLYSNNDVLKGIGEINEAGGMFFYYPTDKLAFALGGSGIKYSMNGRIFNDLVFSASLIYKFNNWLKFYLYGQYSVNTYANSMAGGYGLSPLNSYGAGLIIGVANKKRYSIDLNVGVENAYNPLSGKWEIIYNCAPQITLKRRR